MPHDSPLFPNLSQLVIVTADNEDRHREIDNAGTRDHEVIRRWAARHQAAPATGEPTGSGPATVALNDGDAGIRFNFPGVNRFRSITWEEWFQNFETHDLVFLYSRERHGQPPDNRYRLVPAGTLDAQRTV